MDFINWAIGFARIIFVTILFGCAAATPPQQPVAPVPTPPTSQNSGPYCTLESGATGPRVRGIVGGAVTENFSSVIRLAIDDVYTCTGTIVSPTTVITAGHCVIYHSTFRYQGIEAIRSIASKQDTDIAVLVFPAKTFQVTPSVLNTIALKGNEALTLVGYGQTDFLRDNEIDGFKRIGCNQLVGYADRDADKIIFKSDKGQYLHFRSSLSNDTKRAMTGRGDSGGPIFINGRLAGVVSFGGTREQLISNRTELVAEPSPNDYEIYEFDTNISAPSAMDLLRRAVKEIGAEIPGVQ